MQTKIISFRSDILPLKNVLYRLALRITLSHEDAEDTVQDTMVRLWKKRDQWQQIDNIEAFAMTICRNIALDKERQADRRNLTIEEATGADAEGGNATQGHTPHSSLQSPFELTAQRNSIDTVRAIIDALPERQRSCMQLRDIEGRTYKEIGTILGLTEEQVKVTIYRARQTVKQKFQETEEYGL